MGEIEAQTFPCPPAPSLSPEFFYSFFIIEHLFAGSGDTEEPDQTPLLWRPSPEAPSFLGGSPRPVHR